ncbi:DUF881 domain-containing protein [Micromonospora sp. NBC_01813]|uniref:DUF881 domain-containing protein n=1 Tax=Micromonospora sp. NBC_01813 TaxID=2975988 RepID=UPI002DDBE693|nr:DUF881 domain-containing protein [Micromonospora sp. NBC_01813]WSA07450.1 DUF881 domain-containing protein [Micromonospora sp. NBC_01813]
MEYTSGSASWRDVVGRALRGLLRRRRTGQQPGWSPGVPLIALLAGLLFTTTATTAGGTALREDRRPQLTHLIDERRTQLAAAEDRAARLRDEVDQQAMIVAGRDQPVAEQRARVVANRPAAGFTALAGPGIVVELDDAPRLAELPDGASNDDLVVHQSDVQAVVNALWAGGAEAMSIMDGRVLTTSAVRCVGNTLLLHGEVYSPPFQIAAIGDPDALRQALDESEGVQWFRNAVTHYQVGYRETVEAELTVPAFDGSTALRHTTVPESAR